MKESDRDKKQREVFLKRLGEYLKKVRQEKGITGAELARRCFMDKPNITRLEKGRVNPSIYFLKKICDGLEIGLDDFIKDFNIKGN